MYPSVRSLAFISSLCFWNIIVVVVNLFLFFFFVVVVLEESLGTNVTLDDDEAVAGIELVVCDGSRVEVIVIIVIISAKKRI